MQEMRAPRTENCPPSSAEAAPADHLSGGGVHMHPYSLLYADSWHDRWLDPLQLLHILTEPWGQGFASFFFAFLSDPSLPQRLVYEPTTESIMYHQRGQWRLVSVALFIVFYLYFLASIYKFRK